MPELEYRVKLVNSNNSADNVVFYVSPDLAESRTVNYKTVDPIHAPGQIYAYTNTMSRTFQLSGVKFISRNRDEADVNLLHLWRLRTWTLPAFGADPLTVDQRANRDALAQRERWLREQGVESGPVMANSLQAKKELIKGDLTDEAAFGTDPRGAPPSVLYFTAYAHTGHLNNSIGHINNVPVVITNLNIPYPSDVDYFPTKDGVPMPTIMAVDMTLAETHSPRQYEKFSLNRFKRGLLPGF